MGGEEGGWEGCEEGDGGVGVEAGYWDGGSGGKGFGDVGELDFGLYMSAIHVIAGRVIKEKKKVA